MNSAIKIAACILNKCGSLSTMKLQKLLFYSQAYHLVKNNSPLFKEEFQAWENGPVVRELFDKHKGNFIISAGFLGNNQIDRLEKTEADSILHVIQTLGKHDGNKLSSFTHSEEPWLNARKGCPASAHCENVITKESIENYYSSGKAYKNPVFAS